MYLKIYIIYIYIYIYIYVCKEFIHYRSCRSCSSSCLLFTRASSADFVAGLLLVARTFLESFPELFRNNFGNLLALGRQLKNILEKKNKRDQYI